jgi:RNA polymerase sigma-70 factor (ECF subfamily)
VNDRKREDIAGIVTLSQNPTIMVIRVMLVATKPQFETLVEAHSGELFGYLWRLLCDEADARDCLQDVFLRAYRAYGRLRDFTQLRAWLYKIATNTARTQLSRSGRRASQTTQLDEPIASREKAVDVQVVESTELAAIKQAVASLPDRQRAALMMRKYQELEYSEIAAALNCSEEAARANVYQALRKLRQIFKDEVNDD